MEKLHYLPGVLTLLMVFGSSATSFAETWSLEPLRSVEGFQIPECAEVNPANGTVYVSNIFGVTRDTFKALDSNGYISTLEIGGKVKKVKAIEGTKKVPIHGAFGSCFLDGYLYFNDLNGLKRCPLEKPSAVEVVAVPGADHGFNDATCDANHVYVTGSNAIFRVNAKGEGGKLVDLKGANGVKCWQGKLFAATSDAERSDLYEIDLTGEKPPMAFGLAPQFVGLDGVEILEDGTFLITDCRGHKVYTIAPDRKTVTVVVEGLEYPADLGVDHRRKLVYIPQFFQGTVEVYRLKQED